MGSWLLTLIMCREPIGTMNKNAIILAVLLVALSILCSARGEEEKQTEDLKKKENFAIIDPHGAPIVPSTIPVGPVVGPVAHAILPAHPVVRPNRKGLLMALLRERPGLLRRLLRRRLVKKIVPVLPTVPGQEGVLPIREDSFEGSYVAVSGRPGQRAVHIVNGRDGNFAGTVVAGPGDSGHSPNPNIGHGDYDYVFDLDNDGDADFYDGPLGARPAVPGFEPLGEPRPGLISRGRNKIGFSPLPRCSYLNTDLYGEDVGDGKGISSGSATGCKEACSELEICKFWTYREGWARDCYLKRGRRGDPTATNAVPKVGYVSGTKGDVCACLANSSNNDEEVCPVSYSRPIYPWKPRKNKNKGDRGRRRCTDASGNVIPCAIDASCFDANGARIPGCEGRGRGRNNDADDGGVYRYDYDDFDLRPTTTTGTVGSGRCVDKNGVVIPCDQAGIDDGILGREVVTTR